ncbi:prephenate dehydratase [Solitalea koreensis]|uniref:prephenate dehydratase n=1 Tax=Solitalea koreensis TaxID=543615 RepID=A0A521E9V5_9SPHI|nr:prephenate dehydratase [Solitalea koreensis]SMO79950.1 prephenate dehydratase [Solitalea koreensis]
MNTPRVAIQGIKASFHEEAALKYFGDNVEVVECTTFKQTCEALKNNKADFAVMAIENSIAGSLLPNYNLLREYNFPIVGEVYLHIQLHLLALPGVKFEDVKYVHSHPIAIRQCGEFFEEFPNLEVLEKSDTAACARNIRENNLLDTVAIANLSAAKLYDLEVLERRIESNKKNFTRFLILAKDQQDIAGVNKSSICFQVGHTIGSLAKVLNIFSENHINLTKIQSMPIIGKPSEYNFYVDLEWEEEKQYDHCMRKLLKAVTNLAVMGEYKKNPMK